MIQKIIEAKDFPEFFRRETIEKIEKILAVGDCIQIVGNLGSGVSALGKQLAGSKLITNRIVKFVNLDLVTHNNQNEVINEIKDMVKNADKSVTMFLDPFERLIQLQTEDLFNVLAGLRKENINKLNYVFTFNKEFSQNYPEKTAQAVAQLIVENTIYLPALNWKEAEWFINQVQMQYQVKLTENEKATIFEMSGGNCQTIKRLIQARNKGASIEEIKKNPRIDTHLSLHLKQLVETIDANNKPKIPILETYLSQQRLGEQLTNYEEKLLKYLEKNIGKICNRDELIEAVWGKDKAYEVNNHALDQLICRVRKKINNSQNKIDILRGRGIRFNQARVGN